jgi:hypothetical protein
MICGDSMKKYYVAVILMVIMITGITMINYHLRILFHVNDLDALAQGIFLCYCVASGWWVGWNGAKYLFDQFIKR